MARLAQFDYIFAISMLFAFLDAWSIGANDVANSFASSISSRSLKYWQAMILAGICEWLGAVLVGSRVSDTIRSKIIDVNSFNDDPAALMLTLACALVGSSVWLTIATKVGMPVSTTHSITGAVIGSAIAAKGAQRIHWGWDGVSQIIASWFIAPVIAGIFASIVFLITKFGVLEIKNFDTSLRNGLILVPILVFGVFCILTMLIVWKGTPSLGLDDLSSNTVAAAVLGVGAVAFALYMLFLYPYFRRKLVHNDWTLKWYDMFKGPIYWFKSTDNIPPMPEGHELVPDYYLGRRPTEVISRSSTEKNNDDSDIKSRDMEIEAVESINPSNVTSSIKEEQNIPTKTLWWNLLKKGPKSWPYLLWLVVSHGFTKDVISLQANDRGALSGDLTKMYAKSKMYDNKIEYLFSLLQAITASTMSFAHGANDIANAAGPLASIYLIWRSNTVGAKADVPIWVLCYTASALVIGCWTFGYRIISNLGNKLILQSPSRGFSIELGAAATTVMATQLAIPVSTTQSAVGATVFIGLCNRDLKAVNWRMVTWVYLGWFFTLPIAGLIAGLLNAIILNAPHFGGEYNLS